MYRDCRIGEIRVERGNEFVELRVPGGEEYLRRGEAWGDVDGSAVAQEMIRRTIREHLDKEKRLHPQGIKVLSLFFIDRVERYRRYEDDGSAVKGDYAVIFEEEYRRLAKHPDYRTLFQEVDLTAAAEDVHDGYFSIDRRRRWADTAENNQANRDNAERAYNLIMKDKEKLLSLDTPLKFIFSHSALREGWDNPNVFQICALARCPHRAGTAPDDRERPAPVRQPPRRTRPRLRDQHADGRGSGELRGVRRATATGDRGRNPDSLRHRGEASVCKNSGNRRRWDYLRPRLRRVAGTLASICTGRTTSTRRDASRTPCARRSRTTASRHRSDSPRSAPKSPKCCARWRDASTSRTPMSGSGCARARGFSKASSSRNCGIASSTRPPTGFSSTTTD